MERSAKQILREKKQEKNAKRYNNQLKGEDADRRQRFESEDVKRDQAMRYKIEKNQVKDQLGHKRFHIDFKATEKRIE